MKLTGWQWERVQKEAQRIHRKALRREARREFVETVFAKPLKRLVKKGNDRENLPPA